MNKNDITYSNVDSLFIINSKGNRKKYGKYLGPLILSTSRKD